MKKGENKRYINDNYRKEEGVISTFINRYPDNGTTVFYVFDKYFRDHVQTIIFWWCDYYPFGVYYIICILLTVIIYLP